MLIKQLLDEDFVNYKKPSMFIGFPTCTWKCEKDCGQIMCQNKELALSPSIEINTKTIVDRFNNNAITQAIVMGGLEPMDSWIDLCDLIGDFRQTTDADIVIYTGYEFNEIKDKILLLKQSFANIIVKLGRFVPNQTPHYDEILGVKLASDNQYAKVVSE